MAATIPFKAGDVVFILTTTVYPWLKAHGHPNMPDQGTACTIIKREHLYLVSGDIGHMNQYIYRVQSIGGGRFWVHESNLQKNQREARKLPGWM